MTAHVDKTSAAPEPAQAPGTDPAAEAVIPPRLSAARRLVSSTSLYLFGVIVVLFVGFTLKLPGEFNSVANVRNILMDASMLIPMAIAETYVMISGGIDLSVASVLVFANVCAAKTVNLLPFNSFATVVVGTIVAIIAGVAWGTFNGFCVTRLRVPALITTLGTTGAALGVANLMTGGVDIGTVPSSLTSIETASILGLNPLIWVSVVVAIISGLFLAYTRFGRHTYVIGSNVEAARRAGINVNRHLMKLYALSGACAGLAGMLTLVRFTTTTIGGHTTDALAVITGVVLGGTSLFGGIGTIVGTIIGTFIPTILNNGLVVINVDPFWQQVTVGFILITAVWVDQLRRRRRSRS